jgi:hypothetical protein
MNVVFNSCPSFSRPPTALFPQLCSMCSFVMADLPPAKRRKTLADSIISTAFSAALIGTAVGMTAYRMYYQFWAYYCIYMSDDVVLTPGGVTEVNRQMRMAPSQWSRHHHMREKNGWTMW